MTKTTELAKLREPFPPSVVGKLPRNVAKDGQKSKCNICGGYHAHAAIHLDYVGHAEVTDRLLSVDPEWSWEPFSLDERGLPAFILNQQGQPIGLWIKLTVCGVTRPGYGSVEGNKFDAVKELIGDALRNAAMRFGVALDLWAKFDLESQVSPQDSQATPPSETSPAPADSGPEIGSGATDVATAAAEAPQAEPGSDPGSASPPSEWWVPFVERYGPDAFCKAATKHSKNGTTVTDPSVTKAATKKQRDAIVAELTDSDWTAPPKQESLA